MDDIFSSRNEWFADGDLVRNLGDKTVLLRCDPADAPAIAAAASRLASSPEACERARLYARLLASDAHPIYVWRRRLLVARTDSGRWLYLGPVDAPPYPGVPIFPAGQRLASWKKDLM